MVRAKYQDLLDLGEKLNIQDGNVEEADGKLKVWELQLLNMKKT